MTRITREGRIFDGALAVAAAALALAMAPIGALAQTPGTAGPIRFDLFTGDSVDLNSGPAQRLADAARRAQAPGECPLGRITIHMPAGDATFQRALGSARRDAVLAFLNGQGINPSRFFAEVAVGGTQNNVRLDLDVSRDTTAPTLDVQWTPPKGTKVKTGNRITAKVTARDDTNRWQSGITTIDLNVEGGGSFGFGDYPPPQPPCERAPSPQTLEGVYTVRANPPPLVRLRVVAKDYAGNETEVWADFPTGDWYGTIKKTAKGGGHNHTIDVDYSFEIERSGTLKGNARARIRTEVGEVPGCTMLWTYSPSEFDVPLSGRRNGEEFEITLEPGTITSTIERKRCGEGVQSGTSHINPLVYARTKYRIPARDGETDATDLQAGALPWGVAMRDTIKIHRAQQ